MALKHPDWWKQLAPRYAETRPRKMLALDGGGIRGLLTLGILKKIEALVQSKGYPRLCDYFDYIGGTSTGAIIAAGLARGMSAQSLIDFYIKTGPDMFQKSRILDRLKYLYTGDPLREKLAEVFGSVTTLEPDYLNCLLLVVTKNITTDSPWPISSNPEAKYNDPTRKDCNLRIPLWHLVRASTAAPVYFPPEVLPWDPTDQSKTFVFTDGGVTPYNCPAFLMYRMATEPRYALGWESGEDKLLIVSVGTGEAPNLGTTADSPDQNILTNVAGLPGNLMYSMQIDQDTNCRTVGRCTYGLPLDREIGDLIPRTAPVPARQFLYARYNADLSPAGLATIGFENVDSAKIQKLDGVENMDTLLKIGDAVSTRVDAAHFGPFL